MRCNSDALLTKSNTMLVFPILYTDDVLVFALVDLDGLLPAFIVIYDEMTRCRFDDTPLRRVDLRLIRPLPRHQKHTGPYRLTRISTHKLNPHRGILFGH